MYVQNNIRGQNFEYREIITAAGRPLYGELLST